MMKNTKSAKNRLEILGFKYVCDLRVYQLQETETMYTAVVCSLRRERACIYIYIYIDR